jgi:hypothetical protein
VRGIEVHANRTGHVLSLRYYVDCALHCLAIPDLSEPERSNNLWQHTCFEAFVGADGTRYCEFNFSPSSRWAAYLFDGYRTGIGEWAEASDPTIALELSDDHLALEATIGIFGLTGPLSLSAVIEETDGTKSYWALAHPPGKPDFHHPTCFAATLPPPSKP